MAMSEFPFKELTTVHELCYNQSIETQTKETKMKTIYLDLDGVIFDFDSAWFKRFCVDKRIVVSKKTRNLRWYQFVEEKWFEKLDLLPDAAKLIRTLRDYEASHGVNIEILSSAGGKDTISDVRQQKLRHLKTNGIEWKANIVDQSSFKVGFAHHDALLIDDYANNTNAFIAAGGHAILYHSYTDSVAESLKKFVTGV